MDVLLLLGQRLAGPQLLQDVVKPGQREVLVRRKHALPMRIELLGEIPDRLPLRIGGSGNGKGSKQRVL